MDLFNNEPEEEKKQELPILKILIGIISIAIIAVLVIVLIIVLKPKQYTDYNGIINGQNIECTEPTTNEVSYNEIKEEEIKDDDNNKFYFGEYCPLKQFYLVMGESYGTETYHRTQMTRGKDYIESNEDKMKLAETYLVAYAMDFYKKNNSYPQGIYPVDVNRLNWGVSMEKLNEYFRQFLDIQLSEEAYLEYIKDKSVSGYEKKDENDFVFSISNQSKYTYCPVIVDKTKTGDNEITVKIELVDYDKVDKDDIYTYHSDIYGDFKLVKKGEYNREAVLEDIYVVYEEKDDGRIILKHCRF